MSIPSPWCTTSPPAKLNLFLEILARRDDGFHELDTVMTAIDWRDELSVRRVEQPGVQISVDWLPNRAEVASSMQVDLDDELLAIPTDEKNLVVRALLRLTEEMKLPGGWEVKLGKRIPSGAGMGGASSDAAAALRLGVFAVAETMSGDTVAATHMTKAGNGFLHRLAAEIGSDVPFFLGETGVSNPNRLTYDSARATGRGERLQFFSVTQPLHGVVIFPAVSVSTAAVYGRCQVPQTPQSSEELVRALTQKGDDRNFPMQNTLQDPARGLSSRIDPALECLSNAGLTNCHMTGSGSACFALANSSHQATAAADLLRGTFPGGALVRAITNCPVPSEIRIA